MFFVHTWQKVLDGSKTQTRRLKRGPYQVGKTYAVQPSRGHKAIARIRIKRVWEQGLDDVTQAQVRAEGFTTWLDFASTFRRLNRLSPFAWPTVWAFEFELVK